MAMTDEISGIAAALSAQFFMATGFIIWDTTWNDAGGSAFSLNLYKCSLASPGFLLAASLLGFASPSAADAPGSVPASIGGLVLSGLVGIVVGDLAWLEALRILGASRVLLVDTLKPFAAAALGRVLLGEPVRPGAAAGMALTACGIFVVATERERRGAERLEEARGREGEPLASEARSDGAVVTEAAGGLPRPTAHARGYALAAANVLLDTWGSVLTRQHGRRFTTWTINLIRFGSSGLILASVSVLQTRREPAGTGREGGVPWYRLPEMSSGAWRRASLGVLFVTFCCPALSNYALFQIVLALALTLGSTSPLFALFLQWMFHGKEKRPTVRAVVGAVFAVAGVAILSWFGTGTST